MTETVFKLDQVGYEAYVSFMSGVPVDGTMEVVIRKVKAKGRTRSQNRCLHDWIAALAEAMNKAEIDMREVLHFRVEPTPENVKIGIVHRIMKALYPEIESTADLDTVQIQKVYEQTNATTADLFGISLAWPDKHNGGRT